MQRFVVEVREYISLKPRRGPSFFFLSAHWRLCLKVETRVLSPPVPYGNFSFSLILRVSAEKKREKRGGRKGSKFSSSFRCVGVCVWERERGGKNWVACGLLKRCCDFLSLHLVFFQRKGKKLFSVTCIRERKDEAHSLLGPKRTFWDFF